MRRTASGNLGSSQLDTEKMQTLISIYLLNRIKLIWKKSTVFLVLAFLISGSNYNHNNVLFININLVTSVCTSSSVNYKCTNYRRQLSNIICKLKICYDVFNCSLLMYFINWYCFYLLSNYSDLIAQIYNFWNFFPPIWFLYVNLNINKNVN